MEEPLRDFFPFLFSFKEALDELEDKDRLPLYDAITDYAFWGEEPLLASSVSSACWKLIRPLLAKSRKNYENGKKGADFGKKGGNPNFLKGQPNPYYKDNPEDNPANNPEDNPANNPLNENEKEKEKENVVEEKKRVRAAFSKPTIEEIYSYMGFFAMKEAVPVDARAEAAAFMDYYTANGWHVGRNPMKNWQAAVRGWIRRSQTNNKSNNYGSRCNTAADNIRDAQLEQLNRMAATLSASTK